MKVLILGASGSIGFPVAQALSRAGHTVYGLTRSTTKAEQLAADEIFPIVGAPSDPDSWIHLVPTLDVIIEALGGTADLRNLPVFLLNTIGTAAQSARPPSAPKISYIYTSGIWVHGPSPNEFVSDTTPLASPATLVSWRPAVEQAILKDERVNGIVIRPALLYGKSASLFDPLFEAAATGGKVAWYGKPGGRFSLIHPDDLADLYVRTAEKAPILGGLAIDAGNENTEPVGDFLQKLVEISGAKGPYEWTTPSNPFEEALSTTQLLRPYLAKSLLGWQQKKPGLTEGLPMYYAAWRASRGGKEKGESLFAQQTLL
ncbi:NAD(P)-binding protein [Gyrodon lividus]|nr:NAD(P)-binding protein [Gyrodon lividus]